MDRLRSQFDKVFIHKNSLSSELAGRCFNAFPSAQIEIVDAKPFKESAGRLSSHEFARSKRNLFITEFEGQFFKRCPGARPGLLCCNYFVLNWGQQCDFNCSYCYLQSFINSPVMTLYSNIGDAIEELRFMHKSAGAQRLRVGTGETVDSLSLDDLTGFAERLIQVFREFPNWTVEFKTKSSLVEQFLDVPHIGNAIVSWSINPQTIIEREEHGTASLEERFSAAEKCLSKGFPVAFHIDPVIFHEDWENNYLGLVDQITQRFRPAQLPFLSVGALRFQPEQRHMMRERFGMESLVMRAEMSKSADGKLRYPSFIREKMFKAIMGRFAAHSPDWRVFLCMETPETWLKDYVSPFKDPKLSTLFDQRVVREMTEVAGDSAVRDGIGIA